MEIMVNNGRKLVLEFIPGGVEVSGVKSNNELDYSYKIPEHDIVMLLNYYENCKNGTEKSDYIEGCPAALRR